LVFALFLCAGTVWAGGGSSKSAEAIPPSGAAPKGAPNPEAAPQAPPAPDWTEYGQCAVYLYDRNEKDVNKKQLLFIRWKYNGSSLLAAFGGKEVEISQEDYKVSDGHIQEMITSIEKEEMYNGKATGQKLLLLTTLTKYSSELWGIQIRGKTLLQALSDTINCRVSDRDFDANAVFLPKPPTSADLKSIGLATW
ncbi:MAG TPA: hypothetical protein VKR58_01715, partial [Aquella sp.]|nr:hypothetical protein [Aquella sp.]